MTEYKYDKKSVLNRINSSKIFTPNQKTLLKDIYSMLKSGGEYYKSNKKITEQLSICDRTVTNSLSKLKEYGIINIENKVTLYKKGEKTDEGFIYHEDKYVTKRYITLNEDKLFDDTIKKIPVKNAKQGKIMENFSDDSNFYHSNFFQDQWKIFPKTMENFSDAYGKILLAYIVSILGVSNSNQLSAFKKENIKRKISSSLLSFQNDLYDFILSEFGLNNNTPITPSEDKSSSVVTKSISSENELKDINQSVLLHSEDKSSSFSKDKLELECINHKLKDNDVLTENKSNNNLNPLTIDSKIINGPEFTNQNLLEVIPPTNIDSGDRIQYNDKAEDTESTSSAIGVPDHINFSSYEPLTQSKFKGLFILFENYKTPLIKNGWEDKEIKDFGKKVQKLYLSLSKPKKQKVEKVIEIPKIVNDIVDLITGKELQLYRDVHFDEVVKKKYAEDLITNMEKNKNITYEELYSYLDRLKTLYQIKTTLDKDEADTMFLLQVRSIKTLFDRDERTHLMKIEKLKENHNTVYSDLLKKYKKYIPKEEIKLSSNLKYVRLGRVTPYAEEFGILYGDNMVIMNKVLEERNVQYDKNGLEHFINRERSLSKKGEDALYCKYGTPVCFIESLLILLSEAAKVDKKYNTHIFRFFDIIEDYYEFLRKTNTVMDRIDRCYNFRMTSYSGHSDNFGWFVNDVLKKDGSFNEFIDIYNNKRFKLLLGILFDSKEDILGYDREENPKIFIEE